MKKSGRNILIAIFVIFALFILNKLKIMPTLQDGTDGPTKNWSVNK